MFSECLVINVIEEDHKTMGKQSSNSRSLLAFDCCYRSFGAYFTTNVVLNVDNNHIMMVIPTIEGHSDTEHNRYRIHKAGAYNSKRLFIVFGSK